METDEPDFDDDGVPWASPDIQANYEAALGRFMLAFNRLDNLLTEIIKAALDHAGRVDLVKPCVEVNFGLKLLVADLLKLSPHGANLRDVPIDVMRSIAAHRNNVAHGHFDQNPFDGQYEIVGRKRLTYSASDLDGHAAKAEEAWTVLRQAEAIYIFAKAPPLPE